MTALALPEPIDLFGRLAGLLAGGQCLKGQDRAVARAAGMSLSKAKKIRLGYTEPKVDEYRRMIAALIELEARHEQLRAEHRRISELLEPRRIGGAGAAGVGAVGTADEEG